METALEPGAGNQACAGGPFRPAVSSIAKKGIMAASGSLLCLFVILHLAGNATMFYGREAFNAYAGRLHSLGFLLHLFTAGLLLVFLTHIIVATLLFIQNCKARPVRYQAGTAGGGRTWGARTMPYTGLTVLAFLVVHVINFKTAVLIYPSEAVRHVLGRPGYAVLYGTGITALTLHLSHGCWSLWQTLGLNHPYFDRGLRTSAVLFSVALGAIFLLIPLLAVFSGKFLM